MGKPANRGVFWKSLKSLDRGVFGMRRGVFWKPLISLGFEKRGGVAPSYGGGQAHRACPPRREG